MERKGEVRQNEKKDKGERKGGRRERAKGWRNKRKEAKGRTTACVGNKVWGIADPLVW